MLHIFGSMFCHWQEKFPDKLRAESRGGFRKKVGVVRAAVWCRNPDIAIVTDCADQKKR
jgi:hypothetical protein